MKKFNIVNLKGINLKAHPDLLDFMYAIKEGDVVGVENKEDCILPLDDNEYCLTFSNDQIFTEEPFTKEECISIFGDNFDY